jgi:dihydroflavonol-4-reductase
MKILITGITGVLGSRIAQKFSEVGEIHGLKRTHAQTNLIDQSFPIIWHEGDLLDVISLEEALKGIDLVIHAAGLVSFEDSDKNQLYKTNWEGTTNLVNAMLELGIPRIIHVSSVAALGKAPDQVSIDETQKWIESPTNSIYAISKYLGELEVWRGVQEGLQALVIHPSVVLTKISDKRSSAALYQYVLNENSYYPLGNINYIDVRDAVDLLYLLYHENRWNERFILNAAAISYKDFFRQMALSFGKRAPFKPVTPLLLRLLLAFQPIAKAFNIQKLRLNKQTALVAQLEYVMDNSKLSALIAYEFRSLEDTFAWALSND